AVCFIKKPIMRILPQPIFFVLILIFFSSCGDSSKQSESNEEETQKNAQIKQPVNVTGEEVSYSTDSVDMKGYISYNSEIEGKRPGILVIHEWWGHTDYVRKRADMLAELGYVGFAMDMYGDGKSADHPDDAKKYMSAVMQNMDGAKARFDAAYKLLASHPNVDRIKFQLSVIVLEERWLLRWQIRENLSMALLFFTVVCRFQCHHLTSCKPKF